MASLLHLPPDAPGQRLYRADLLTTVVFSVAAALAAAFPRWLRVPFAALSVVLFVAGVVVFLWAYAKALGRSREQTVSVAMIYGMSGTAPKAVRQRFHLLTLVQTVVAVVTAAMRPFTAQAFGILVPMLGLGLAGLWAAQHGTFSERVHGRQRSRTQAKESTDNG